MDSRILVAVIAAVAIVGGAAAFLLLSGNDDIADGTDFDQQSGALLIYGNANGDSVLDAKDVEKIGELIDSGTYLKTADANMDGKIDSKDVEIVEELIAHRSTKAYYLDMTDGPTAFDYPITSFMGIHEFVLIPMVAIGAERYMDGYTLAEIGVESTQMLQTLFDKETNVNVGYNGVNVEKLAGLPSKPKYMVTHWSSISNENKVEKSGIQIIHLDFSGYSGSASAIVTAGFMVDLANEARDYVGFMDNVVSDIASKVTSRIDASQRKSVICGYMTNCIDHSNGTYTPIAVAAGARALIEGNAANGFYVEFNRGDEWILAYNEDYFFYMNAWAYDGTVDRPEEYRKAADYFTTLRSYKAGNFVVFNSVLPPALIAAYMAEVMYPDLVGEGYGDGVNQRFIDRYFPEYAKGFRAADSVFFITHDMVKDRL